MVGDIAIYLEGGGPTAATSAPFRRGMSEFLQPLVQLVRKRGIRWKVIPCGGRREAFDAFCDALDTEPGVFNVLLVDSETLPATTDSPWSHLRALVDPALARKHCKWCDRLFTTLAKAMGTTV